MQRMHCVLKVLVELRKEKAKASIGALICKKLGELQQIYLALQDDERKVVQELLSQKNPALLQALEKKGSKIAKPLELAEHITDDLPDEFEKVMPTDLEESEPSSPEIEDAISTIRINAHDNNGALKAAIASVSHQLDSRMYGFFRANDIAAQNPTAALMEALEVLKKTQLNKEKMSRGIPKPIGYDNAYRETLLKQMAILMKYKVELAEIMADHEILKQLDNLPDVPSILIAAGMISEKLIESERKMTYN